MKTLAHTFLLAIGLLTGGCAAGHATQAHVQGPDTFTASTRASSGSVRREIVAYGSASNREPSEMLRADRGIPTPQPAREPSSFAAGPVPQPPLPGPDPHRGGNRVSSRESY